MRQPPSYRMPAIAVMEPLESRLLLTGDIIINEFMADNAKTLKDKDGQYSDWIEIYNGGASAANLNGWYLTDSLGDLTKWRFPSVSVASGAHLVVFASGKDVTTGPELHTNFRLGAGGDYLALVQPDGHTIATEFNPEYPAQYPDVSYGYGQDLSIKTLVGPSAAAAAYVPPNDNIGLAWTGYAFDDSSWSLRGTTGVGYQSTVPGLAVRDYLANVFVGSLTTAESVISSPGNRRDPNVYSETAPVVNYLNTGGDGHYSAGRNFPGVSPAYAYCENIVSEATGWIAIPAAGLYTFGVNSDDGFSLTITGATTTWVTNSSAPAGSSLLSYDGGRGPGDTFGTYSFPTAGKFAVRMVWFQGGGGAEVELFATPGSYRAFNYTDYKLVGDTAGGGLAVESMPIAGGAGSYDSLIGLDVETAMMGVNASAYVRVPFTVTDLAQYNSLTLKMKYDDGFVAYLNGVEVARRNAPASVTWNSAATAERSAEDAMRYEEIDISSHLGDLRLGQNVLAVQGLNYAAGDTDFLVVPELVDIDYLGLGLHYFATPTPGAANLADYYAYAADTKFDNKRGFYDAPFDVVITTATPDATIRYTLDGSEPTATTGTVYTGPIHITRTTVLRAAAFKTGYEPSEPDTQTYIFTADVIQQPSNPPGYPTSWGTFNGSPFPADYGMDPNVVGNPTYAGEIRNDLKSIPVMSIVTSIDDMFGPNGIYSNTMTDGLEVPGSLEYIRADGGKEFQINAGIRIYGGWGRHTEYGKHSFRIDFNSDYGPGKLNFDLFGGTAAKSFDTLVLRSGFNDSYVGAGGGAQWMTDEWSRRTILDMGNLAPHGTYVHLFVNGLYWGLYNPLERPDDSFASTYLGGSPDDYDAIHSGSGFNLIKGDLTNWTEMFNLANTGHTQSGYPFDANALASDANYQLMKQYLDLPAFVDYILMNFYGGNWDWDWHNWYAARRRVPGGQWHFFPWDEEGNLQDPNANIDSRNTDGNPTRLFQQLRANAEFRVLLIDRIYKAYFNDGALTATAAQARYQSLSDMIYGAVVGESARWGDYAASAPTFNHEPPYTRAEWIARRDWELNSYFPVRSGNELNNLRGAGMYPALAAGAEAPNFSQNGGNIQPGFALTMTNPNPAGTIYYTLDGSDPRLAGGGWSPNAVAYTGEVILTDSCMVRARVLNGTTWSAVHDATFLVPNPPPLRITELMYHPADPASGPLVDDDFEFIEVKNVGTAPLDIGGMRFADGVTFTFPSMTLQPNGYALVVSNQPAFQSRYPSVPAGLIAGQYTGLLRDTGEHILLEGKFGEPILDFSYSPDWYPCTDGEGFSLNFSNPLLDRGTWGDKDNWWPSMDVGGTPGADYVGLAPHSVVVNELLSHTDADPRGDWVELKNLTSQPIDIGGWFLSDDAADLKKYRIAAGTVLQPAGQPGSLCLITRTDNFGNPADPGYRTYFSFSEYGGTVYLTAADSGGNLRGYREAQHFNDAQREVAFTRYVTSTGNVDLVAESVNTPLAENAYPKVGPVVISEVMYHPADDTDEFIELHNTTGAAVPLYDPANPANTWQFRSGITYDFPTGTSIPADGRLLLVSGDPAAFRTKYGVPADVQVLGPFAGLLNNAGDNVKLYRPGEPDPNPPYQVPYYLVDRVEYEPVTPWPAQADGYGPSLQRVADGLYGNDPVNWYAGPDEGTPGVENGSADVTPPRLVSAVTQDGVSNQVTVTFNEGLDPVSSLVPANYNIPGLTVTSVAPGANNRMVILVTSAMQNAIQYTLTATHVRNLAGVEVGALNQAQFTYFDLGTGLWGAYYQYPAGNINWANLKASRLDATVNFDWGGGSPDPVLMSDLFSVRWTGKVKAQYSETYTFYTVSDDGVRLWVNNVLLVDNWTNHSATENSGTIVLAAGQKYDIKMEYYEDAGSAVAKLLWSSPSTAKQVIPTSQLFSSVLPPAAQPDSYGTPQNTTLSVSAANGVLANDVDPNGNPLTAKLVRRTAHGTLVFRSDGSFTYAPTAGYEGTDFFTYKASNGLADSAEATVSLLVDRPAYVTAVMLNDVAGRSVSAIDPGAGGIRSIKVTFSKAVTFAVGDVVLQEVTYDGTSETVVATLTPETLTGSGTTTMVITFAATSLTDTWVKVRLRGDATLRGAQGLNLRLDGEPKAGGSGRTYIYNSATDLPSGNGQQGGDAVFYVGSLRGDYATVGGAQAPDGRITEDDLSAFVTQFQAGSMEADFRGAGFGASAPDGLVTAADMDGFLAVYQGAIAQDRHLDPLPNPGPQAGDDPGPLAAGLPEPVELVLAASSAPTAPQVDVVAPAPEVTATQASQAAPADVQLSAIEAAGTKVPSQTGGLDAALVADAAATGGAPLASSDSAGGTEMIAEPTLSPDGGIVDLLALPALALPLGV